MRRKKTPLLSKRCFIHGSTQLLQESPTRPLFSMHDNDCRRTRLPACALTRPLRNALHRKVLPESLSAGDDSSLLHSFLATLFFTAFCLLTTLYAGKAEFVKQIPRRMVKRSSYASSGTESTARYASFSSQLSPNNNG